MENIVTGIDIGGTHITVCLVDISNGKVLNKSTSRGFVDTSLDEHGVIAAWTAIINEAHQKTGYPTSRLGIAMPGPFDYESGVSYIRGLHKYESLYGLNVKDLLAQALSIESSRIKLVNDASAYLLGEKFAGAAKDYNNIVGITLGTGLGSAAYYDNSLEEGDLYRIDFNDAKCEDYGSARWIVNEYERLSGRKENGVKEIAERYPDDEKARTVFEKFGQNLYRILHKRYREQRPEVVVIGGNIAKAWDCFIPALMKAMKETGFYFEVRPAGLGEEAALIGAAYLWQS